MAKNGRDGRDGKRGPQGPPGIDGQDADPAVVAALVERRLAPQLEQLAQQRAALPPAPAAPAAPVPALVPWRADFERDDITDMTTRVLLRARDGSAALSITPVVDEARRVIVYADIEPLPAA